MKKICFKNNWAVLILINTLPFALNIVFFTNGLMDDLFLFLPIFASLATLNFKNCSKTLHFVLLQIYILICIVCLGYVELHLFNNYVVNDFMNFIVGILFILLEAVIDIIATIVLAIVKAVINKKH